MDHWCYYGSIRPLNNILWSTARNTVFFECVFVQYTVCVTSTYYHYIRALLRKGKPASGWKSVWVQWCLQTICFLNQLVVCLQVNQCKHLGHFHPFLFSVWSVQNLWVTADDGLTKTLWVQITDRLIHGMKTHFRGFKLLDKLQERYHQQRKDFKKAKKNKNRQQ